MIDIIREAHEKFKTLQELLQGSENADSHYYDTLNEAAQAAYIIMNEGMCESTTVCHQCAEHRDLLYTVIPTLELLASGESASSEDFQHLARLREMVRQVLERISSLT